MKKVIVCINHRASASQPSCGARGGDAVANRLKQIVETQGWPIQVEQFECLGDCQAGPNLKLAPLGSTLSGVTPERLDSVLAEIEAFAKADADG